MTWKFWKKKKDNAENKSKQAASDEGRISFIERDDDGNEVETVLDFEKNKAKLDKIEKALDNLENDVTDIRHELKILSDELIKEQFINNPLLTLQIFTNPEYLQDFFTNLYGLACTEIGLSPDFEVLEDFGFAFYEDIVAGPIVLIRFPQPLTLNEIHYVAVVYDESIEGLDIDDEHLVGFRYFTLEESIDECCLVEWIGEDRTNFGGGFIADEAKFLGAIKQIVAEN